MVEAASSAEGKREAAFFLVRCLGIPGLVPEGDENRVGPHFPRKLVCMFEQAAPDLLQFLRLNERKLTVDKFDILRNVQRTCTDLLAVFRQLPADPAEFASRRQEIFHTLKNKFLNAYLNIYDFSRFANSVRRVLNAVCELLETSDVTFGQKLHDLFQFVDAEIEIVTQRHDFLATDAWLPFLSHAREVLRGVESEATERFRCAIRPRRAPPQVVERRYPLHQANRVVRVKLPLVNDGPGAAVDTTAQILSGSEGVFISDEVLDLGTVPPGEFAILFDMLIGDPQTEVPIFVEIGWLTVRGAKRHVISFDAVLLGQKPNINWEALEGTDPYSLEVAHGDEFVGRSKKVLALANRLLKERMQSSYITGQKRVGKTSLAFAVQDHLREVGGGSGMAGETASRAQIEAVYLEYGDYARSDAVSTVEALGASIAGRLIRYLPPADRPTELNFRGSLAPLNQIAELLFESCPQRRFVIILDEFDEIHPEMYRFGALAEAFFSNLRTLSAKRNIALVLVGGENMPFIIGAQGDQLNKFVREPLDYFSRSNEWDDFVELARQSRQPDTMPLNWYDSAINELFNFTNGHPYYTKLVCARVFQNAVAERDSEVTVDEIRRAVTDLVEQLDINAFAHFWKDGIPQTREEAEVVALKRCRVLVAIARTPRQGEPLTADAITQNKGTGALTSSEIVPIINDFCRRDILREKGRGYEFVLPIFEEWLVQTGTNKLVADTLGDEMADAIQRAEDKAYVTSPEIAAVVERWPLYRGRRVSAEDVRRWLDQRSSFQEQRLLFKLLQHLRFISEEEVREKLRTAHSIVKLHTNPFTPESRSQRRYDIVVTYVDGPAKSGSRYADKYAEENLISTSCVIGPESFAKRVIEHEEKRGVTVSGIVIVDDIAATGQSLSENIGRFMAENQQFVEDRNITVVAIVLLATREADERVREAMQQASCPKLDLRICEILEDNHYAFGAGSRIWIDLDETDRAKALMQEIGRSIYKNEPLGYGGLGLLAVFYDTCPNNSLPLLHASGAGGWTPLFLRPKN